MSTLSVLYVVRNEQDCIEKSLASIQPIADEIVIVDTGSLDNTLSICRKFKYIKILSHAWVHDFSRIKNYGIKQCKSDWVLTMDADEVLDPASASAIRSAVLAAKPNISGFSTHIIDHETELNPNAPANPSSFFPSPQVRVFRKMDEIKFEGKVYESIEESAKRAGGINLLDAKVHHFLWRGKGQTYKEGRLRYYAKLGAVPTQPATPAVAPIEQRSAPAQQTAIVVCAYNVLSATKECITAVSRHTKVPYCFHFVDNGSRDGTYDYMRGTSGKNPIKFHTNAGAARGKNSGAKEALGNPQIKYLCFLDNDTIVTDGWLERMISVMEKNPKIGVVGPLSSTADGPQNSVRLSNDMLLARDPEYFLTDSINGFCMLTTTDLARKIGLFDESFGYYGFEDKDFCHRVKQAGFEIAVANRAYVEHRGKNTVVENKLNWQQMMMTAANKFSQKWSASGVPAVPALGPRTPPAMKLVEPPPRVSFVLLTHNRLDMTKDCINSMQGTVNNFELVVVDNASTDNTVDWIKSKVPDATIIKNDRNLGVPMARNQGIRATTTPYICILDNDVMLHQGWFNEFFQPIKDGAADAVGLEGWQLDNGFSACYKCQSSSDSFDYLGGACTIFKRKIFETIGLLDEGFSPAYYEDVDICVRAKQAGFKLTWKPTSKIVHREHATLVRCQKTFNYQEALSNSHVRFAKKMRREIEVIHEILPPLQKKLKILYLGMYYDYGVRERGTSFEHDNFFPALKQWDKAAEFNHFDFVEVGKQHGIAKMSDMLYENVQRLKPDVIFSVWYDENHDPRREMLSNIRRTTQTKVVSWFCDSHYRYENFDRPWADHVDFCVTTSTIGLEKYRRDGLGSKVIKSQWGASPSYRYMPELQKDIDVLFVGQPHGDRRQVIEHLKRNGINVVTFGHGWHQRLSFPDMVTHFNRAKINLNLNNGADARVKQIKGRNFEVPACGGFLLTGVAENLHEYYEFGKEIETYNNLSELTDKIKHYLAHPKDGERIAKAGYERTMRDHTYAHRFDQIFKAAGLL